jgi:hypothetical protein
VTGSETVRFADAFLNHGALISDPATLYSTDLNIGPTRYLTGGVGDQFSILANFIGESTSRRPANSFPNHQHFCFADQGC